MRLLKRGFQGKDVQELQLALRALGLDPGDIDGKFGQDTHDAVVEFQTDIDRLEPDGKVGSATREAIDQALGRGAPPEDAEDVEEPADEPTRGQPGLDELTCSDETWDHFQTIVELIRDRPVVYGPGRGLFHEGKWVITYGAGKLGAKKWKSRTNRTGPSFHCSSWTNFMMGVLARRNEDYTHGGNTPALKKVCESPNKRFFDPQVGPWRGYGDICRPFKTDGSTRKRGWFSRGGRYVDLQELWDRRTEVPTFFVCGQSTKRKDGTIKWGHHTVLFVIDHRQAGSPLYRIAADGYKDGKGWSAKRMVYEHYDEKDVAKDAKRRLYRGYCLDLPKSFDRPVAEVVTEDQL